MTGTLQVRFHGILPITPWEVVLYNHLVGEEARLRQVRCFVQVYVQKSDFTSESWKHTHNKKNSPSYVKQGRCTCLILLCFNLLVFTDVAFFTNWKQSLHQQTDCNSLYCETHLIAEDLKPNPQYLWSMPTQRMGCLPNWWRRGQTVGWAPRNEQHPDGISAADSRFLLP